MGFFERLIGAAASAIEFHFLRFWWSWLALLLLVAFIGTGWHFLFSSPRDFVPGTVQSISRGATAPEIAEQLAEAHVIRYPLLLTEALQLSGKDKRIPAGAYRFGESAGLITVTLRLIRGDFGLPPSRITFIEGMTVREMAERAAAMLPEITAADFISAGQPYEGYLFPDTYIFSPSDDAETVVYTLRSTFVEKTKDLDAAIAASGYSQVEILTMASLIEKEARIASERQMISGILWNRVTRGMPLQVDAVFGYIYGRSTYSPSFADLATDSPYNTYKYKGLPPGPIANPGLDAIEAALNPAKTNALFYLTGRDGVTRYAATYAEHLANQRRHLP